MNNKRIIDWVSRILKSQKASQNVPAFERLEPRLLMSTITQDPDGTVRIEGTSNADRVAVRPGRNPGEIEIIDDTGARITYLGVTGLNASLEGGDDVIHIAEGITNAAGGTIGATIIAGDGNDQILCENSGNDSIDGGSGNDLLGGGAGNDRLDGGTGKDSMLGGAGNDTMNGGGDDDVMFGEEGDDQMNGNGGKDHVDGGTGGRDTVRGGTEGDTLIGGESYPDYKPSEGDRTPDDILVSINSAAGPDMMWDTVNWEEEAGPWWKNVVSRGPQ